MQTDTLPNLKQRIARRDVRIGVLGLTPEGLSAAVRYSRDGFTVTCIDWRDVKVERVRRGMSFSDVAGDRELAALVEAGLIKATTNVRAAREVDFLIVFHGKPSENGGKPYDIRPVFEAASRWLKKGVIICLDDEAELRARYGEMKDIMEAAGRRYGVDYLLGTFGPDRF